MSAPLPLTTPSSSHYYDLLLSSLTNINTFNPPVHTCSTGWSFHGLVSGPTSIAYLFYRLSTLYPEEFTFKGQGLLEWGASYGELGRYVSTTQIGGEQGKAGVGTACENIAWKVVMGCVEEDEGVIGEVLSIGRGVLARQSQTQSHNQKGLLDGRNTKVDMDINVDLTMSTGWPGYLYLLRVLKSAFPKSSSSPSSSSSRAVQELCERVINLLLQSDEVKRGVVNTENLEVMIGVVTQIILSRTKNHIDGVEGVLAGILDLYDQDQGSSGEGRGWESTTALVVNCLSSITSFLPIHLQHHVTVTTERARTFLYSLPLTSTSTSTLTSTSSSSSSSSSTSAPPTLQPHGLVTRALAFIDPHDHRFHDMLRGVTGEVLDETRPGWKDDAGRKDEWVGLVTGEAGRAWGWGVAERSMSPEESGSGNGSDGGDRKGGRRIERRILGVNDV